MSRRIRSRTSLKVVARLRKKQRSKSGLFGTAERPRLVVFKSAKHIYASIVDDVEQCTLASASTLDKELKKKKISTKDQPSVVAEMLVARAKSKKIQKVVFDRNGYLYHGKVKLLADKLRENGLQF